MAYRKRRRSGEREERNEEKEEREMGRRRGGSGLTLHFSMRLSFGRESAGGWQFERLCQICTLVRMQDMQSFAYQSQQKRERDEFIGSHFILSFTTQSLVCFLRFLIPLFPLLPVCVYSGGIRSEHSSYLFHTVILPRNRTSRQRFRISVAESFARCLTVFQGLRLPGKISCFASEVALDRM